MAIAEAQARRTPLWAIVLLLLVTGFVAAVAFADASSIRSGYPFLAPPREPGIVHYPGYLPPLGPRFGLSGGSTREESAYLERSYALASGGGLRIWESTRYGADVKDAVGVVVEGARSEARSRCGARRGHPTETT